MPFKVSSRPAENQILISGLAAMEPMLLADAEKFGAQILAECNHVRQEQARLHGRPPPALDTIPSYEVPERVPEEPREGPPAHRSVQRTVRQTSHQGSSQAAQTSAVHSSSDRPRD
jgi:hypothetical protein